MSQALDASSYVYQGLWINHTKASVQGATLTLSPRNAAVLVAILALFVQMTGSQLWTVIQFTFHQSRATHLPRDALYHQQQAILRNNSSDLNTVRQLFRLTWAWRQKTKSPFGRTFHLMFWALTHFFFFGLAGVFSSTVVDAGDAALSRSPYCGVFNQTYLNSLGSRATSGIINHLDLQYQAKSQVQTELSQEYVNACYNNTEPSASCTAFQQKQLTWSSSVGDVCPFSSPVCLPSAPTVTYDTGLIDSSLDLGLNAHLQDRILYRRVTTCTPLNDQNYVTSWRNISLADGMSDSIMDAYYGASYGGDRNATFSYGSFSPYLANDQYDDTDPYQLHIEYAFGGAGYEKWGSFMPITELYLPNADVTLLFLSFDKQYESPIDDPWFAAHQKVLTVNKANHNLNTTVYARDRPFSTLACTEQHQVCTDSGPSASNKTCTPLMGGYQVQSDDRGVSALNFTTRQNSTYTRVFQAAVDAQMQSYMSRLRQRDMPLLARRSSILNVASALPDNQWQLESEFWHSIAMAHLQRDVVDYGTGQMSPDTAYIALANTTADRWLCQNMFVRGTAYQSFSIVAMTIIFVVGVVIVVLSMVIEEIGACFQCRRHRRRKDRDSVGREMWRANDLLQIQRMLYEHDGVGTWHDGSHGVPVTDPGQEFGMLHVGLDLVGAEKDHASTDNASDSSPRSTTKQAPIEVVQDVGPRCWVETEYGRPRGPAYYPPNLGLAPAPARFSWSIPPDSDWI